MSNYKKVGVALKWALHKYIIKSIRSLDGISCGTYSKLSNCHIKWPAKRLQLLSSLFLLGNRHSVTVVMETEAGNHFVTDEEYTRKRDGVGRSCPFVSHLSESTFWCFSPCGWDGYARSSSSICVMREALLCLSRVFYGELKIVRNCITSHLLALRSKRMWASQTRI